MRKWTAFAVAVATAAIIPAGALAAKPATLVSKSFTYQGYSWQVSATDNGASDALFITATKRSGSSTQMHTYSFQDGVAFSVTPNLRSATLSASLGSYGSMNAHFAATGKVKTQRPSGGCTGPSSKIARGNLSGFGFTADTTFFREVEKALVGATILRQKGSGQVNCPGGNGGGGGGTSAGALVLSGASTGTETLSVTVAKAASGAVTQSVLVADASGIATHMILARGGSLTAADDLSTAAAEAAGAFLSGSLSFTADGSFGNSAFGSLSGNYTAQFDSIGARQPAAAGATGSLTRS